MAIREWFRGVWGAMTGKPSLSTQVLSTTLPATPQARYDIQDAYYENNDLYAKLATVGMGPGKTVRGLRNPASRIVEFYPAHLWPEPLEDLPIVADAESLVDAARKILEWSNWGEKKQEAARKLPKHGDLYLKAEDVTDADRVYIKIIEPREVTDFEKDERGNATKVRLDIPITVGDRVKRERTRTEIWSKKNLRVDIYEHDQGPSVAEEDLKDPTETRNFSEAGIDFVPFVHCQFQAGAERGMGAFAHLLEKINEVNKMASRSSDMFFRHGKPLWQLLRNESGQGAVSLEDLRPDEATAEEEVGAGDNKESVIRPPGLAKMEALVPNIPYEAGRLMVQDQMDELTNESPELTYYAQRDKGDPSGRAIGLMLSSPRKRGEEVRYNGETAILKTVKMCITIAKHKRSLDSDPGEFGSEEWESLKFEERPVLPVTELEQAEVDTAELKVLSDSAALFERMGMDPSPLKKKLAELLHLDPETEITEAPNVSPTDNAQLAPEIEAAAARLGVSQAPSQTPPQQASGQPPAEPQGDTSVADTGDEGAAQGVATGVVGAQVAQESSRFGWRAGQLKIAA